MRGRAPTSQPQKQQQQSATCVLSHNSGRGRRGSGSDSLQWQHLPPLLPRVRGRSSFVKQREGQVNNKLLHCYGEDLLAVRRHFVELMMAIEDSYCSNISRQQSLVGCCREVLEA